jgi:hypothetical protein
LGESASIGVEAARSLAARTEETVVTECRDSDLSRQATARLLLPEGRPGVWLLLLAAVFAFVVYSAFRTGL